MGGASVGEASVGEARVGGASVGEASVGGASGSETGSGGTGVAVEPYKMTPCTTYPRGTCIWAENGNGPIGTSATVMFMGRGSAEWIEYKAETPDQQNVIKTCNCQVVANKRIVAEITRTEKLAPVANSGLSITAMNQPITSAAVQDKGHVRMVSIGGRPPQIECL